MCTFGINSVHGYWIRSCIAFRCDHRLVCTYAIEFVWSERDALPWRFSQREDAGNWCRNMLIFVDQLPPTN